MEQAHWKASPADFLELQRIVGRRGNIAVAENNCTCRQWWINSPKHKGEFDPQCSAHQLLDDQRFFDHVNFVKAHIDKYRIGELNREGYNPFHDSSDSSS